MANILKSILNFNNIKVLAQRSLLISMLNSDDICQLSVLPAEVI